MKFIPTALLMASLATVGVAHAGLEVGGTRLIYDGGKREASLSISNPDKVPYLVQSWVEATNNNADKAPFIITPPLFRFDGSQQNVLRVVHSGGDLPSDKESLYWMNIKSIPSASSAHQNTLQIAVKTRIKLIYRPQGLKGIPEEHTQKLSWHRESNRLQVTNPTPFYMNFQEVKVGDVEIRDVTYVAPMATESFALPPGATGASVSWKIISDYGGMGESHKKSL